MVKSSNKKQQKKVGKACKKTNKSKSNTWKQKHKAQRNQKKKKPQNVKTMNTRLNLKQLKKLHRKKRKEERLHLNKPENIFNLSLMKSLHRPLMDLDALKKQDDAAIDHSPKSTPIVPVKTMEIDDDSHAIQVSNLPSHYEPGTVVDLPQQINVRSWKTIQNTHNSKLIEFNPKCAPSFEHSMYDKKNKNEMKAIENQLRDEIRADKQLEKMKKQQRLEMRKQNMLRGIVVKPIRNMHKLKRFSKKQWKSVMKASVAIHNAKNAVRGTFVPRDV